MQEELKKKICLENSQDPVRNSSWECIPVLAYNKKKAHINTYTVVCWRCITRSKLPLSSIHSLKKQHLVKQPLMLYKTQHLEYILVKHIIKCKPPTRPCCPCIRSSGPIFLCWFRIWKQNRFILQNEKSSVNFSFFGFFLIWFWLELNKLSVLKFGN